ncbi:MAG: M48 family metalloprotease [Deltaproteobacteria bacterium]|nr:M48 family metalloprotease [Deltaproteobacteria bacterium]MBI3296345.1 M48 family metalloprotease [Deltaproteobacteria bacterium]
MKIALATLLLLAGCASPSRQEVETDRRDDLRTEVNDELNMGREMAAKLLGHMGAYADDAKAIEYVNLIGQSLVSKVGRAELNYRFGLLNSQEINAFATPGGYIFLTRGLLQNVADESELAAVLGHEIAHVNEKHMYNEIAPKRDVTAAESVARVMSRGKSDLGKSLSQLVNKGLKMLLEEGMGLEKERAADSAGILYVEASGYNPFALVRFLKRISTVDGRKIPKTAPSFPDRIAALEKVLKDNGLADRSLADAQVLNERFTSYLPQSAPTKKGT